MVAANSSLEQLSFSYHLKKICISNIGNMFTISQATGELARTVILGQHDSIFSKVTGKLVLDRDLKRKD